MDQAERRLAAIMFTDIVGFTALGQRNESLSLELLEKHRKLLRPIIINRHGREVKTIGDAFLVEFSSALDAVNCAFDIQNSIREFNSAKSYGQRIHLRIGIHLGDVVGASEDILGDAVNVASRIQSMAESEGVCLTRQVYDQVKNKFTQPLRSLGYKSLKNVSEPIEIFKIVMPWEVKGDDSVQNFDLRRIAVLPFNNISPDPSDAYISDGMTEELISTLSQVPELKVISRTSVMTYKNASKKLGEIAKELKVGTVLEGSVRKTGNRIRITVQLIDAINDEHLWVGSYDRELSDIFSVQGTVASEIAKTLEIRFSKDEKESISKVKTTSPVAYQLHMAGVQLLRGSSTQESVRKAMEYFHRALEEDTEFAEVYAGLATAYERLGHLSYIPYDESYRLARRMAEKALSLDISCVEAHTILGYLLWNHDFDFKNGKNEFERAIQLNPGYSRARIHYARALAVERNLEKALEQVKIAEDYDPLNPGVHSTKGVFLWIMGDKKGAFEAEGTAIRLDPSPLSHFFKIFFLLNDDRLDEAEKEIISLGDAALNEPLLKMCWGYIRGRKGDTEKATQILEELKTLCERGYASEDHVADVYAGLGNIDKSFEWWARGVRKHSIEPLCMIYPLKMCLKENWDEKRWRELRLLAGLDE